MHPLNTRQGVHISSRTAARSISHYRQAAFSFVLAVALIAGAWVGGARAQEPTFAQQVEGRVLALVNDLRAQNGLSPLEREARLDDAARYFSGFMASSSRLDHRADGTTPAARVKQRGYVYCNVSENIAMEFNSRGFAIERLAKNFVDGWSESPTHRENMLDRLVTQTGLGVARNAGGEYYATQVFGRQPVVGAAKGRACPR